MKVALLSLAPVAALLAVSFANAACSQRPDSDQPRERDNPTAERSAMKHLQGQVIYRERIMPPPNAELQVNLEDVSRADAPADVIASQRLELDGAPPYEFDLEYDPARIHDRGRYVLRARIEAGGKLLFTNTESIPAFGAEEPVEILVRHVARD